MKRKKPKKYKEYNFKPSSFIVGEDENKPYGRQPLKAKDFYERMDEWQLKINDLFASQQETGKQLQEVKVC